MNAEVTTPSLSGRNIISISDLTYDEIILILETSKSFLEVSKREIKKIPTLRGKTVINLFYEPSTRTRTSFEIAGKRLSADVINISEKSSAAMKGETLSDTSKTINAMNADALIIRHPLSGSPYIVARNIDCPVINAGDGWHEHPTQALLDLFTIKQRLGLFRGLKAAIVGDILHSRVARSNILAFTKMGIEVTVVAPQTLIPKDVQRLGAKVAADFDDVISDVDIIYMLRIQLERMSRAYFPSIREYCRYYGLNQDRLRNAKDGALVMHPGPINRGIEIESEVADLAQSTIVEQVTSGVAVRMAILYLILSGEPVE